MRCLPFVVVVVLIVAENLADAAFEIELVAVLAIASVAVAVVVCAEVVIDYGDCLSSAMMNCSVVIAPMNQYY